MPVREPGQHKPAERHRFKSQRAKGGIREEHTEGRGHVGSPVRIQYFHLRRPAVACACRDTSYTSHTWLIRGRHRRSPFYIRETGGCAFAYSSCILCYCGRWGRRRKCEGGALPVWAPLSSAHLVAQEMRVHHRPGREPMGELLTPPFAAHHTARLDESSSSS